MYCENCGQYYDETRGQRFCAYCGAALITPPAAPEEKTAESQPVYNAQPVSDAQPISETQPTPETQPVYDSQPISENQPVYDEQPISETPSAPPTQGPVAQTQYPFPAPEAQPEPVQPKKSNAKAIIALLAGFVLLVGIAAVVGTWFLKGNRNPDPLPQESASITAAATDVQTSESKKPAPTSETATVSEIETEETVHIEDLLNGTPQYAPGHYVNSSDGTVNVRASHDKASDRVSWINGMEEIEVTEVFEDTAAADPTLRWWGKVTAQGVTGWAALYYLSPTDQKANTYSEAVVEALWERLNGFWNSADQYYYIRFTSDADGLAFSYGMWKADSTLGHVKGEAKGDINGLLVMDIKYEPVNVQGNRVLEGYDAQLQLDLSELSAGRLVMFDGMYWASYTYAGATAETAEPDIDLNNY